MKNLAVFALLASLVTVHCFNDELSLLLNRPFKLNKHSGGSNRVSGGEPDWEDGYSFQVQLTELGQHVCGAVLIDDKWALTAAHCVNGRDASKLSIVSDSSFAGTRYITSTMAVGTIKMHPNFSPATMANNIALVAISPSTMLSNKHARAQKKVLLPEAGQMFTDDVTLVGYGSISNRVPREESQKRIVSIPMAALVKCRNLYSQNLISSGMLCAGNSYTGQGLCQGDAGSGLTQFDQELNSEVLVGIGSFGFDCGHGRYPSVFTAVSEYVAWIRETVPEPTA